MCCVCVRRDELLLYYNCRRVIFSDMRRVRGIVYSPSLRARDCCCCCCCCYANQRCRAAWTVLFGITIKPQDKSSGVLFVRFCITTHRHEAARKRLTVTTMLSHRVQTPTGAASLSRFSCAWSPCVNVSGFQFDASTVSPSYLLYKSGFYFGFVFVFSLTATTEFVLESVKWLKRFV